MTGPDSVRRRRLLAALAGAGATVGLAGCLGSGGNESGNDDDSDERSPTEDGGSGNGGGGTGPGAGEQIEDVSCSEFGSTEFQSYGTGNTPLVFDFEFPNTWSESSSSPSPGSDRYTVSVHSDIIAGSMQTFLTVGQWFEPITPENLEQEVREGVESFSGNEELEPVSTLQYAGETVDVYSTPEYPEGLTSLFWLPHETADGLRYFQTVFKFGYSNKFIAEVDGADVDIHCDSLFADLTERVLPGIVPNQETTISSEL